MKQLKKILSVLLVLAMIVAYVPPITASAEEQTHTLTFDDKAKRTEFTTTIQVWEENGITVTNNKASSTNNVADYAKPARFYANSSLVIEMAGMTKIVFDANGSSYATAIKNSIGTTATATVSSDKVTVTFNEAVDSFTISKLTAQVRMDSITVTVLVGGGDEDVTKFNVTFDLNYEGAPAPTTMQIVDGESYGKLPVVARKAYTFDGWFKTADYSGEAVTAEDIVSEEHTLYAKWTPKPVATVSFDLNGAEDTSPEAITVVIGDAYETLPMASREGYVFGGWYTDSGCTGTAVKVTDVVEATHTLYAKWIKGATVQTTIDFSTKAQRTAFSTSQQVWANEGLTLTNNKGGSTSAVADYCQPARFYKSSDMKIECDNMTKIVFVANTNDYANDLNSAITGAGFTSAVSGKEVTVIFSAPVAEMAFSLTTAKVFLDCMTVDALAPAPAVFDVSFDLNGAEGTAPETVQVEEGKAYGTLPEVSREGYTFDGWFTEAACTNAVTAETIVTESHTLYAKWTYIPTEDSSDIVENWGLTLKDEVIMKFDMNFTPEILADNEAYVEVAVNGSAPYMVPVAEDMILSVPVFATQMTETITLTTVSGGEAVASRSFTLLQYCKEVLNNNEYSQYHALVKELLNYGDAAMKYFKPSADKFAGEEVDLAGTGKYDVPVESPAIALGDQSDVLDCTGASLVYRDKIAVRYYFTGSLTGCTFSVTGASGKAVVNAAGGYVEVPDILPQNLDQEITLSVTDGEGKVLTITYCPMNYIVRMSQKGSDTTKALVKALYNYYLAAKDFAAQTV